MWRDAVTRASAFVLLLLLCNTSVHCCGPGRGGTRRRSTRKLMPLIFKEHVPNVYENTLGASGLTEGAISRTSRRFQELVPNYNPDIIFRDEEGTGADRLMTERCKERLDTLAISVMNQWPGVRLRVKEAWEEDTTRHNSHSLHYEGRAVDIATSDSDRSKYGMLGRLAVEAGFDWVYYEARSHIHCSVKSESPALNRLGGCFPGTSAVLTPDGLRPVSSLRSGQLVEVVLEDGRMAFSPVLMMIHANSGLSASFLHLTTDTGRTLSITPSHLLMRIPKNVPKNPGALARPWQQARASFAGEVVEGDHLLVVGRNSSEITLEQVVLVRGGDQVGVFAPLTPQGNMVVDGVMVSCYAVIKSQALAHWAFLPVRGYYAAKGFVVEVLHRLGMVAQEEGRTGSFIRVGALTGEQRVKLNAEWNNLLPNRTIIVNTKLSYPINVDLMNINLTLSTSIYTERERKATNPDIVEIHWYPRLLYSLARLILPKVWIAS